jgi:hypothetical protein
MLPRRILRFFPRLSAALADFTVRASFPDFSD